MFGLYEITGKSMGSSLKDGSVIVTIKVFPSVLLRVGMLIVFPMSTLNTPGVSKAVKRVFALPGDIVLYEKWSFLKYLGHFKTTLKNNEIYVLGDNALESTDSRFIGPIKCSGYCEVVLFTWNRCNSD